MFDEESDEYDVGFDFAEAVAIAHQRQNERNLAYGQAFYDSVMNGSHSNYFRWEERSMKDSHLLNFMAPVPGPGEREGDESKLNSITGGDWDTVGKMEKESGWLESQMVVKYQDLYNLASQLGSLITAWRSRMDQCQGNWSKEQSTELMRTRQVTRDEPRIQEDDEKDPDMTGMGWWLSHFVGVRETEMSVEDRMRYSVGRGMAVFGSLECLDQLAREIYNVKNLVHKFVIGVCSSTLPVVLPYPVLLSVSKLLLCSSGGVTKLGWAGIERTDQLVESKYVNRVYLAMLDIYNVIREIMFKHAAETLSPNFPSKFVFLRTTLARNLALLESFHQLTGHEQPQADKIFFKELKELKVKIGPSKLKKSIVQDRVEVSGDHLFFVHATADGQKAEAGLVLEVHHLQTGNVLKQFTAVPQYLLSGDRSTFCTKLYVLGDLVALSLSQGYPKTSLSSKDQVFVVNWVDEKLVMRQTVFHSLQLKAAVREREDYLRSHFGGNDDKANTSLGVSLSKKAGHLFLLHSEVVLPELEPRSELDNWGQYVRIWEQQEGVWGEGRIVQELSDVRVLDLKAGLLIYEEAKEKHSISKQILTKFNGIDVVVKWLDLGTGKEVYREDFVGTGKKNRPVYSIASHNEKETKVFQYKPGEDVISFYIVDEAGTVLEILQQVAFPALGVGGKGAKLSMQLFSENLISFSHSYVSPSLERRMPFSLTRCVLAMEGTEQLLAEVYIPNSKDEEYKDDTTFNGYHTLAPADCIVQEGNKLVILKSKKSEISREWELSVRQFEFQKSAMEVIFYDKDVGENIVKKLSDAPFANKDNMLAREGERCV